MPLPPFEPPSGVRVIYSDVDGTMLGRAGAFVRDSSGAATLEPAVALTRALGAGIELVPTSGRALRGLVGDGRLLGCATAIGEMGAVISYEYGGEVVRNLGDYPGGEVPPVTFMETSGAVRLLLDRFRLEHHTPWSAWREYTHLLRGRADFAQANRTLADAGFGWCELQDNGGLHGAYLGLRQGESHAYHLVPRGTSKASAVALDRARRGLGRGECVAIGDSTADLGIAPEVAAIVIVRDALERDEGLAAAATSVANAFATERAGNLGWADAVSALASAR
jgi:hypothetical protein